MGEPELPFFEQVDDAAEVRAMQDAEADIAAGRLVSHEAVADWLRSWGTQDEVPRPICGA